MFNIRLSVEDHQRLQELAHHYAITGTSVLRMLVKQRHDEAVLPQKMANARNAGDQ